VVRFRKGPAPPALGLRQGFFDSEAIRVANGPLAQNDREGIRISHTVNARNIFLNFLLLASLGTGLCAQAPRNLSPKDLPPSAFKLISIKVMGTNRYQPSDVISASGLQIGDTVSEDDFKKTARLLGESGAFTNVAYSFQYAVEGTKLELQVQDADKFVPVHFENLVWF